MEQISLFKEEQAAKVYPRAAEPVPAAEKPAPSAQPKNICPQCGGVTRRESNGKRCTECGYYEDYY